MSYCRWSNGPLYIYRDVAGGITCCGCTLADDDTSFNARTYNEMIAHVKEHIAAGDKVQEWVIGELERDRDHPN